MGRRVELARALDLISLPLAGAITVLSDARSFLAHRIEDELPDEKVDKLVAATDQFIIGDGERRPEDRLTRIALAIAAIYTVLQHESEEVARQRRDTRPRSSPGGRRGFSRWTRSEKYSRGTVVWPRLVLHRAR